MVFSDLSKPNHSSCFLKFVSATFLLVFLNKYKREHVWKKVKCLICHLESSFCSWDNKILTSQIFKYHDGHKMPGHETWNTFYWIAWQVHTVWWWNLSSLCNIKIYIYISIFLCNIVVDVYNFSWQHKT